MNNCVSFLLFLLTVGFFFPARAGAGGPAGTDPAGSLPGLESIPEHIMTADTVSEYAVTPQFGFDAHHVQGLLVTQEHYFFTSVEKKSAAAWLFRLDRKTMQLEDSIDLARLMDFHPGGIDFDGKYIWVPVAVYTDYSHTNMMVVDPVKMRSRKVFEVDDHIGAVSVYGDKIIGANWSAREFYFWDRKGNLLDKKDSPTGVGYQDCKEDGGYMMCCGSGDKLDWIDIGEWKLAKRFEVGESLEGSPLCREGVDLHEGRVFFLPDDGARGRVYEMEFIDGAK